MKKEKKQPVHRRPGRTAAILTAFALILTGMPADFGMRQVEAAQTEYEIYPQPHVINYEEDDYIIRTDVNVVYEEGIDSYTRDRLNEVLSLKDITPAESDGIEKGKTNIVIGISGSQGYADTYVSDNIDVQTAELFDEIDSYLLSSSDNVITILGKDTDAAFYGVTTLYHIISQLDSMTIRNFQIEDWSDVESRGFIEGYYGNPWSTQDRSNLMYWGGYYKLNSYIYAPKDDPKHNSNWRELYTDEEIETLIKPLAEAGNKSKCRFVYALHPFMYNAISFNSQESYQADLAILQAKYEQVIRAGVRQIAILADDAANFNNSGNLGGNNYRRVLTDMTEWLKEMQKTYSDLKITIPFCPVEYGGNGESYYSDFPENIQIVMTGGKVWGEVSDSFTGTFTSNVGRGPYMWINWPCTDNSKQHLIMGGYTTFLHTGVDPDSIQGIVLNPMQQSEPSKVAIFGNACYSWNIWESQEEADEAYEASFKYVDHNSPVETVGSQALRELSKHMINQNMDSRVSKLEESVELAPALSEFKSKLRTGTVAAEDADALIKEFETLQDAADTYEESAGNSALRDQIIYWLDCWDDTTDAAIAYLNGVKSVLSGDMVSVLKYNSSGKEAFDKSKSHSFDYVDSIQYAEVGVEHIVPFIQELQKYVSKYAETTMNPDAVIASFITNRTDNPSAGSTDSVFDGNDATSVSYRNPVWIYEGDYVGVLYNRVIDITNIRFLLGNGKNHFEHSKLQYTEDGEEWKDISLEGMENSFAAVQGEYLDIKVAAENLPDDFKAMGIRLTATEDNELDAYLNVHEIQINAPAAEDETEPERYTGTVTYSGMGIQTAYGGENRMFDGDTQTETFFARAPYESTDTQSRDRIYENASMTITFDSPKSVGTLTFVQGSSSSGDVFSSADIQYQISGSQDWITAGTVGSDKTTVIDFGGAENVTAVRLLNKEVTAGWVRIAEIDIREPETSSAPLQYNLMRTERWTVYNDGSSKESNLYDGNDSTYVYYDPDGSGNSTGDDALENDFIGYDFGKTAELESAHIVVGKPGSSDKLLRYAVETSVDGKEWTAADGYDDYSGASSGTDVLDIPLNGIKARYIRIRNLERRGAWIIFSEFTVQESEETKGSTEHLYTNTDTDILAYEETGSVSLTSGTVLLDKDEYIGVDLKGIKSIEEINASGLPDNVTVEISLNGIEWTQYDPEEENADARYVRARSSEDAVKVELDEFDVYYFSIQDKSVDSDFANESQASDMRTAGYVENVFDGDLSTLGMITGPQEKGKYIIFDLGQTIRFTSLRYYIVETQLNYLRDADFQISADKEKWTTVLHVGQETANEWNDSVAKDMQDITLKHDSENPGYMYAEAAGLDIEGRYIRVVPSSTYSHRWAAFSEIQINGGAYISEESNRDIITDTVEEPGKIPSNMLDGDYSTVYRSGEADSSFTYRLSDPQGITTVRLIQPGSVSNAEVTVQYIGQEEEEQLGKLNQAVNEFNVETDKTLKSITVKWQDNIPEIAEIVVSKAPQEAADRTGLESALEAVPDTESWTRDSIQEYKNAQQVAREILENKNTSQNMVDAAEAMLEAAVAGAQIKASNIDELRELAENRVENENRIYTSASYYVYETAINKLMNALEDEDNLTQEDADKLAEAVEYSVNAFIYSTANREQAELAAEIYDIIPGDNYTQKSYQALTDAKEQTDVLVQQDKDAQRSDGERVDPVRFIEVKAAFEKAKEELVDITALKAVIEEAYSTDGTLYTDKSYQAYIQKAEEGEQLLVDGSKGKIADAVTAIEEAEKALVFKAGLELTELIEQVRKLDSSIYTEASYDALVKLADDAQENGNADNEQEYIAALKEAMEKLVNISALNDQIRAAGEINEDEYTVSSWKVLKALLDDTEDILREGTEDEVRQTASDIDSAIRSLVKRAQGVEEYRENMELLDRDGYTAGSYQVYIEAYEELMDADAADLSEEDFLRLKEAYEKAELALEKEEIPDDQEKPDEEKPDDPSGDDSQKDPQDDPSGENEDKAPQDQSRPSGDNGEQDSPSEEEAVSSGDNMNAAPLTAVLGMSFLLIVLASVMKYKKRR